MSVAAEMHMNSAVNKNLEDKMVLTKFKEIKRNFIETTKIKYITKSLLN